MLTVDLLNMLERNKGSFGQLQSFKNLEKYANYNKAHGYSNVDFNDTFSSFIEDPSLSTKMLNYYGIEDGRNGFYAYRDISDYELFLSYMTKRKIINLRYRKSLSTMIDNKIGATIDRFKILIDDAKQNKKHNENSSYYLEIIEETKKILHKKTILITKKTIGERTSLEAYLDMYAQYQGEEAVRWIEKALEITSKNHLSEKLNEIYQDYLIPRSKKKLDSDFEKRYRFFASLLPLINQRNWDAALKSIEYTEEHFSFDFSFKNIKNVLGYENLKSFKSYIQELKEIIIIHQDSSKSNPRAFAEPDPLKDLRNALNSNNQTDSEEIASWERTLRYNCEVKFQLEEKEDIQLPDYLLDKNLKNCIENIKESLKDINNIIVEGTYGSLLFNIKRNTPVEHIKSFIKLVKLIDEQKWDTAKQLTTKIINNHCKDRYQQEAYRKLIRNIDTLFINLYNLKKENLITDIDFLDELRSELKRKNSNLQSSIYEKYILDNLPIAKEYQLEEKQAGENDPLIRENIAGEVASVTEQDFTEQKKELPNISFTDEDLVLLSYKGSKEIFEIFENFLEKAILRKINNPNDYLIKACLEKKLMDKVIIFPKNTISVITGITYEQYFLTLAKYKGEKYEQTARELFKLPEKNYLSLKLKEIYQEYLIPRALKKEKPNDFIKRKQFFQQLILRINQGNINEALAYIENNQSNFVLICNKKSFYNYTGEIKEILLIHQYFAKKYNDGVYKINDPTKDLRESLRVKDPLSDWEIELIETIAPNLPEEKNYLPDLAPLQENILPIPDYMTEKVGEKSDDELFDDNEQAGEDYEPGYINEEDDDFAKQLEEKLENNHPENNEVAAINFLGDLNHEKIIVQPGDIDWEEKFAAIPEIKNKKINPNMLFANNDNIPEEEEPGISNSPDKKIIIN